jgi:hypothetical protein
VGAVSRTSPCIADLAGAPTHPAGESGVPRGLQIDLESCMHLLDLMAV